MTCDEYLHLPFRLQVYPLHSTVTLEEQNGVFLFPVPGYRKVRTIYLTFASHVLSVSDVLLIFTGHPFHQHRREFGHCSRRQIWWVLFPHLRPTCYLNP